MFIRTIILSLLAGYATAQVVELQNGRYAEVTTKVGGPGNIRVPIGDAQSDCAAWKDKAWPFMSIALYQSGDCTGDYHRFTKCAEYGDHWTPDRWICGTAGDMGGDDQNSAKVIGGINGVRGYVLMENSCPPEDNGTQGEMGEMDPGIGSCHHGHFKNKHGFSVKNVKGREITGDTDWIDTEWENKRKRAADGCDRFDADPSKPQTKTRTNAQDATGEILQCNQDTPCHKTLEKGHSNTHTVQTSKQTSGGVSFFGINFGGGGEWAKGNTHEVHCNDGAEGDLQPGEFGKWVFDMEATRVEGTFSGCPDGNGGGWAIIPRGEPTYRLVRID